MGCATAGRPAGPGRRRRPPGRRRGTGGRAGRPPGWRSRNRRDSSWSCPHPVGDNLTATVRSGKETADMRSDRLLSLLLLLQARGRVTAPEVAAELEVSVRTVYRDVEALSAAGVPVWTEQGRGGGIALMPGYRTDMTGLTAAAPRALVRSPVAPCRRTWAWGRRWRVPCTSSSPRCRPRTGRRPSRPATACSSTTPAGTGEARRRP